jgi:hypothetical protein
LGFTTQQLLELVQVRSHAARAGTPPWQSGSNTTGVCSLLNKINDPRQHPTPCCGAAAWPAALPASPALHRRRSQLDAAPRPALLRAGQPRGAAA